MTRQSTTIFLYAAAVIVWGTTWINMKYQLGEVAPAASLTYRYLAAGTLVLVGAAIAGKAVRLGLGAHLRCAVQGALMFSLNYWLTYLAAAHLTTGIIAVMFAGTSAMTMLLTAGLERRWPSARSFFGATLGIVGIGLVFWPEVEKVHLDGPELAAGGLIVISVTMFAVGGVIGSKNMAAGQPRYATIGWAMFYGGIVMAMTTAVRGETFGWSWSPAYLWSLMWLTLFGSVVVFVLYFEVVERIGAAKASYATVLFPLVALVVSTFLEAYAWSVLSIIGVPLALIGNGLVLAERPPAELPTTSQSPPSEAEAVEWPLNVVDLPEDGGGVPRHQG